MLDLGGLNEIALSPALDVASVGPGATWDKVYEALEQKSLTVVGGRVSGVGVGGLITGGLSHLVHARLSCTSEIDLKSYPLTLEMQVECLISGTTGAWHVTTSRTSS